MELGTDQAKCSISARLRVLAVVLRNKGLFIWRLNCFHSWKLEASLAAANRLFFLHTCNSSVCSSSVAALQQRSGKHRVGPGRIPIKVCWDVKVEYEKCAVGWSGFILHLIAPTVDFLNCCQQMWGKGLKIHRENAMVRN